MLKHEQKYCPRCHAAFECKAGNISQCQCSGIVLTAIEKQFIGERWTDCLCRNCLLELKQPEFLITSQPRVIFITGGARSGKSRHAQELALQRSDHPVYVATARLWDEEFRQRVARHREQRDERWTSMEEEKQLGRLPLEGKVVVIDCMTLWMTNFFADLHYDIDACLHACRGEIDALLQKDAHLILVSNEIGMGLHADTEGGRKFTDLQGWVNQYIAARADQVILMVSGIPLMVKNTVLQ